MDFPLDFDFLKSVSSMFCLKLLIILKIRQMLFYQRLPLEAYLNHRKVSCVSKKSIGYDLKICTLARKKPGLWLDSWQKSRFSPKLSLWLPYLMTYTVEKSTKNPNWGNPRKCFSVNNSGNGICLLVTFRRWNWIYASVGLCLFTDGPSN